MPGPSWRPLVPCSPHGSSSRPTNLVIRCSRTRDGGANFFYGKNDRSWGAAVKARQGPGIAARIAGYGRRLDILGLIDRPRPGRDVALATQAR